MGCITHVKCRSANSHCLQWKGVDGSSEALFGLLCVAAGPNKAVQTKPFLVKHSILHANRCISAVLCSNKKEHLSM